MSNMATEEFYANPSINELMILDAHLQMISDDIEALSDLEYGDSIGDALRWLEMGISNFRFAYEYEIDKFKDISR